MTDLTAEAASVYRDYEVDGVSTSGLHDPVKAEIRNLWLDLSATLAALPSTVGAAISPGILTDAETSATALFNTAQAHIIAGDALSRGLVDKISTPQDELNAFLAAAANGAGNVASAISAAKNAATISQTQAAVTDLKSSMAALSSIIFAQFGTTAAAITSLAGAVATKDYAQATKTDYVGTVIAPSGSADNVGAFLAAMRNGDTVANASKAAAVNAAGLQTNQVALTTLQQSFASMSSTVFATFGNVNASVTTNATAIAQLGGYAATAWGVTLDTNGYVAGLTVVNGGATLSSFTVRADLFQVVAPSYSPKPIFSVGMLNGSPAITIPGQVIQDGSVATNAFGQNSVSNSAYGSGTHNSGSVTINVRKGGRVLVVAAYEGRDTWATGVNLKVDVANGAGTTNLRTVPMVQGGGSSLFSPLTVAALYDATAGAIMNIGGTPTANALFTSSDGSTYPVVNAYDTSFSTMFVENAASGWIQYQLTGAATAATYTVMGWSSLAYYTYTYAALGYNPYTHSYFYYPATASTYSSASTAPKTWTLQGSNNGTTWTTIDTRSSETGWLDQEVRTYTISSPGSYLYYRLNFTANNGATWTSIVGHSLISSGTARPQEDIAIAAYLDTAVTGPGIISVYLTELAA